MPHPARPSGGFTLVELSIVLVIVGLLVGGILVGKDLIEAAQFRSFLRQVDAYNAAFNTFRVKYNCLPGDCATASQFGLGTAGGVADDGDGNGMIDTDNFFALGTATNTREKYNAWAHLSAALRVTGNYPGITTGAGHPGTDAAVKGLSRPRGSGPRPNSWP